MFSVFFSFFVHFASSVVAGGTVATFFWGPSGGRGTKKEREPKAPQITNWGASFSFSLRE